MRKAYLTGKGLTADLELLYRHLKIVTDDEKQAVTFLLKDKFTLDKRSNSFKHKSWDKILKDYKHGQYLKSNGRNASNEKNNEHSNERNEESNAKNQAITRTKNQEPRTNN